MFNCSPQRINQRSSKPPLSHKAFRKCCRNAKNSPLLFAHLLRPTQKQQGRQPYQIDQSRHRRDAKSNQCLLFSPLPHMRRSIWLYQNSVFPSGISATAAGMVIKPSHLELLQLRTVLIRKTTAQPQACTNTTGTLGPANHKTHWHRLPRPAVCVEDRILKARLSH